jgi:hypothetical protein
MSGRTLIVAGVVMVLAAGLQAQPGRRRALLIGINDYSASRLPAARHGVSPARDVPNLDGTANDVEIMRDLLVALYGFKPADIITLKDQQATRDTILRTLEQHLLATARKGDVAFFHFSGHGSQVRNSRSGEADRLDESLVPAGSRRGEQDIRDKELLAVFNGILDRGAQLTIVLDTCHSGSGARGLDGGLRHRGVEPELRDVADPSTGPLPEDRGALILSAAQDFDLAFETLDEHKKIRGAFTWALVRAMRDAAAGEPAGDTFLRARALLHGERPAQDPVLAGNAATQRNPFLGIRTDRRNRRAVIAVEKPTAAGTYLLQGGWASGVTMGSELRLAGRDDMRLEVTALRGVAHSEARVTRGVARLRPGALLEIITWAAPPSLPLRVWVPGVQQNLLGAARALRDEASHRGIRWIGDPTEATPTHLLRWRDDAWELVTDGRRSRVGAAPLAGVPTGALLFVQLPATAQLRDAIRNVNGIEVTPGPEMADYVLAGRLARDRIEYAWVRPFVTASDRARSTLPLRTAWTGAGNTLMLRACLVRLRTVQAWQDLRSPAASVSHYRLAVRRTSDGALVEDGTLVGGKRYQLVLREREQMHAEALYASYVYAFVIDSNGRSVLLFPRPETGPVENLLPITTTPGRPLREAPDEIPLTGTRPFEIAEPYGVDTYFLLSTDEPLTALSGLEWSGVRTPRGAMKRGPLEELLARTLAGTRAPDEAIRTPPNWSIDKVVFQSVPPRRTAR